MGVSVFCEKGRIAVCVGVYVFCEKGRIAVCVSLRRVG